MTDRHPLAPPSTRAGDKLASSGRLRAGIILALGIGLGLVTLMVSIVGLREVVRAVEAIGWTGFTVFVLYWLLVLAVVGLAWAVAAQPPWDRWVGAFIWARALREAAADILPFSQVGGLVVGARALMAAGVAEHAALASTIVDLTAEMAAQCFYTLLGIGLILARERTGLAGPLMWPALGGLALLFAVGTAFLLAQGGVISRLGRLGQRWLPDAVARADAVTDALAEIYRRPGRVAAAVALHVGGWIGGGIGSWIALRFMGADTPLWAVVAVESLMYAARNLAFALPGGLGVQEATYVLLGPLFGIHAGDALALSLLRRARDFVIGLPVLAIWQAREGGLLLRRRKATSGPV